MTKKDLIVTASLLEQINTEIADEFQKKQDKMVELINQKFLNRPDLIALIGNDNIEMMKDNHANHARFMESIFRQYSPEVLVDTILWVFRAYMSHEFTSTYWAAQLNSWIEILKENLSEESFKGIYPFYKWMQINIPAFTAIAETELTFSKSLH